LDRSLELCADPAIMDSPAHPSSDEGSDPGQIGGFEMLGPLPRLYRSFVVATVLLVGIASGAWVAYVTAAPLAASLGAAFGAAVAVLIAYLMVHDFSRHPRSARVVRRH
jgi:hypothetical protein